MPHLNRRTFCAATFIGILAPPSCEASEHKDHHELITALIKIESGGDPQAVGDGGMAVGVLQIHPIMVTDVNRIIRQGGNFHKYTLDDRVSPIKSVSMFQIYTTHYSKGASDEVIARRWNGGPKGDTKSATLPYWVKVKAELSR